MPPSSAKSRIITSLEGIAEQTKGVPDRALAVWLQPLLTHHRDALAGAEISRRLAALAALAGVDLTAAIEQED